MGVRLVAAARHDLHAHYFDDSLLVGYDVLSLLTLAVLAVSLWLCHREWQPLRHLLPPIARAPPAIRLP
jgi:hypothetical protein